MIQWIYHEEERRGQERPGEQRYRKRLLEAEQEREKQKKRRLRQKKMTAAVVAVLAVFFLGIFFWKEEPETVQTHGDQTEEVFSEQAVIVEEIPGNLKKVPISAELTAEPTKEPTAEPTKEPTPEPTKEPTAEPTKEPTAEPTKEPTPEPTKEPRTYTVLQGDSLAKICRTEYGTLDMLNEICALNGISDQDHIQIGETILLP